MVADLGLHLRDTPPTPRSVETHARWTETRRRVRLLTGRWWWDLEQRLLAHFGATRRGVMGLRSQAKNPFRKLCNELAVNYASLPEVRLAGGRADERMLGRDGVVQKCGLWETMAGLQVKLIGCREMLLHVSWSPELDRVVVLPVTPDWIEAYAHQSAPQEPVKVRWLRWREMAEGPPIWAWDEYSIVDPAAPYLRVLQADPSNELDITERVLGARFEGDRYPFRWSQGKRAGDPFLPWTLYHARRSDQLFDWSEGQEVVDGSLDIAAAWTFVQHALFRGSWPQRWAIGAYVAGTAPTQTTTGPRTNATTDPASLLHLEAQQGVTNPQVGQWGPGADPEMMSRTVGNLERAVAEFDGMDSSHLVRDSANPWSAGALAITREGKRQAQSRYAHELRAADAASLERIAAVHNAATGEACAEEGYLVHYPSLPLSGEERDAIRRHNAELIAQGRMSIVDAYLAEHPGMVRAEAEAELLRIAADNVRYRVALGTAPTPITVGGQGGQG
jgi:hypothetical protein